MTGGKPVPAFERITRFVSPLESAPAERVGEVLYGEFMPACYEPDITDHDYFSTLEHYGLTGNRPWHANVEALDLRATVALLTFVLRADHFCEGSLMGSLEDGYLVRVLRRIAELEDTWVRPKVVTFYHEYEKDGYLSNWYESGFRFLGDTFPTSEHWMMWQKAAAFRDWDTAANVLEATSPAAAKALGKQVKPYSDTTWNEARVPLMKVGLRQKFAQNERLMNDLLSTGSAALAEASPKDTVWGIGIGKDDPKSADPGKWHGRNLLGITLMEVRSELRTLSAIDGRLEWPVDRLADSHVWHMSLLELARVPSTRPAALMYAAIAAQNVPHWHGARDALRKIDAPIGDIDESMHLNMGGGLPIAGWHELLDELALQVRLGRI
jgi:ribA/ribD-fused uncharacterized protein